MEYETHRHFDLRMFSPSNSCFCQKRIGLEKAFAWLICESGGANSGVVFDRESLADNGIGFSAGLLSVGGGGLISMKGMWICFTQNCELCRGGARDYRAPTMWKVKTFALRVFTLVTRASIMCDRSGPII